MSESQSSDPLMPLIEAFLNDTITAEQIEKLEVLLRGKPEAIDQLLECCELHVDLSVELGADRAMETFCQRQISIASQIAPTSQKMVNRATRRSVLAISGVIGALACSLMLIAAFLWRSEDRHFVETSAKEVIPPTESLGSDTSIMSTTPQVRSIKIPSGSATMALDQIGSVTVYGPADFQLLTPMRARLNSGRMQMRVSELAGRGFVVETPYGEVTDLGTEFGLDLTKVGKAGLVVYEGAVDLRVAHDTPEVSGGTPRVERLEGGEGVTFGQGGELNRIMSVVCDSGSSAELGDEVIENQHPLIADVCDNLATSETRNFYQIVRGGFREDAPAYVDRNYEWNGIDGKGIPEFLQGADYIRPFNNDKAAKSFDVTLTLLSDATVYVLFDDRGAVPSWLRESFVDTGFDVGMDEGAYNLAPKRQLGVGSGVSIDFVFSIWKRDVVGNDSVVLGPRGGQRAGRSMYGIVVTPLKSTDAKE
jgi:hypothetical protein